MNKLIAAIIVVVLGVGGYMVYQNYQPAATNNANNGVSGSLTIKGSDTIVQLSSDLVEAFREDNTSADISVTGGGSGTGIASLLNKEVGMANSSREIKSTELESAAKAGLDVQAFVVARDGLSVVVNPSNAVKELTIEQLGKMYKGEITNWKDVGGADAAIVLYGRQSTSGTYEYFREAVVKGDYATTMRNMEGNQAIEDAVKSDVHAVGYVGIGYVVDGTGKLRTQVGVVKVAAAADKPYIAPTDMTAIENGTYPLIRPLFQYLAAVPAKGSVAEALLKFQMSSEGLAVVKNSGFFAPNAEQTAANSALLAKIK